MSFSVEEGTFATNTLRSLAAREDFLRMRWLAWSGVIFGRMTSTGQAASRGPIRDEEREVRVVLVGTVVMTVMMVGCELSVMLSLAVKVFVVEEEEEEVVVVVVVVVVDERMVGGDERERVDIQVAREPSKEVR